ncbi:GLPGLI family protein [Psychroserpens sp.]|uniref:GLPGLI family protein n=1 Tax=Psychroserpens sp. TaxID=2020870 RepID=UPI002B27736B|nr:GLPGLI family protein [Psychroserpens sp.]
MRTLTIKLGLLTLVLLMSINLNAQDFQGQATYISKSTMDLGNWGKRLSEAQKKQVMANLKNRLEKTYVLNFNKEESFFKEGDKLDAMSGATDSWGKNFAAGDQYKNVKTNTQIQDQEFYGKRFLVKDKLQPIKWIMGTETKQIGNYTCFKATASIPTDELTWYSFSWAKLRSGNSTEIVEGEAEQPEIPMTQVEAWYAPQIPVGHGPSEFWGLPGLILEVSAGDTTMLCSKLILNPTEALVIEAPDKGKEITKDEYQATLITKMKEFRDNRMGRGRR